MYQSEFILGGQIALLLRLDDHSLGRNAHPASAFAPDDAEFAVAAWAFANHQPAGRFTDTLPSASATWFPLQTATSTMGVLGLMRDASQFTFTERQATEAFVLQLALVLEKEHFIQAVQHAERLEQPVFSEDGSPDDASRLPMVSDIMTPAIFCVRPETSAAKVVEKLLALKVRRLFVVDNDGILVGVISTFDVLRKLRRRGTAGNGNPGG